MAGVSWGFRGKNELMNAGAPFVQTQPKNFLITFANLYNSMNKINYQKDTQGSMTNTGHNTHAKAA